jgi:hypothetical protein
MFSLRGALRVWQANYCESAFERCARFKLSQEGKPVPPNLLPNGTLLTVVSTPGAKR